MQDGATEDEERVNEHQEAVMRILDIRTAGCHHHFPYVGPARARVSLLPLDDFSSVDTVADNLVHTVAGDKFEVEEDYC